ncbi:MAG: polysaccharide pyruvyl transferase family protein [Blastomonas sp.]
MADRFALLSYYGLRNIGDEIQSLAARQFLPRVDCHVPREAIDRDPDDPGGSGEPLKIILNGWFMEDARHWPPSDRLIPHITSFHITQARRNRGNWWKPKAKTLLLSPAGRDYLRRHAPIGARDEATMELLREHGIDAYYSGCLTLTLERPDGVVRGDDVVACDLSGRMERAIERRTGKPPLRVTHDVAGMPGVEERFARAEAMLATYAAAKAVITSRVHCALPCLAMGTPVLFVPARLERKRQSIAFSLVRHCREADFLKGRDGFDLADPAPNPADHLSMADALRQSCRAFAGSGGGSGAQMEAAQDLSGH